MAVIVYVLLAGFCKWVSICFLSVFTFYFLYIKFDISKKYSIIADIIRILFMKNRILKIMFATVMVSGGIFTSK